MLLKHWRKSARGKRSGFLRLKGREIGNRGNDLLILECVMDGGRMLLGVRMAHGAWRRSKGIII
jgi:hypothetical protein